MTRSVRAALNTLVIPLLLLATLLVPHAAWAQTTRPDAGSPRNTVIWISLDGMRGDYADRYAPPYLRQLIAEGASTRRLAPAFPSITFPNHSAQATGATCIHHGITDNAFHDARLKRDLSFPNPQEILTSEPLWTTAQRQGVRAAVEDWPLSYLQKGPHVAAYCAVSFDRALSDEKRIGKLLDDWNSDSDPRTLRLFMGYLPSIDTAGHQGGPESKPVQNAVLSVDQTIRAFHEKAVAKFKETAQPGDELYLILSTDHGMSAVTHLVDAPLLLGDLATPQTQILTSGPLANIHLDKIEDAEARDRHANAIVAAIAKFDFVTAYTRKSLPEKWGYAHPTRTGDVVLMLKNGYKFDARGNQAVRPAASPAGAHGYPIETCPDMYGLLVLHRFPTPLGGKDLGEVDSLQLHPTAAKLLGIEPAANAKAKPIPLP